MIHSARPVFGWMLAVLLVLPLVTAHAQQAASDQPHLTLEDIFAERTFTPEEFTAGRWAHDGPIVTFIEERNGTTDLIRFNLETGEQTHLLNGSTLQAPDVDRLIAVEKYQFDQAGDRLLLYTDSERVWRQNTKGYYYVYDFEDDTLTPLADRASGFQMFAKFSPDGRYAAFVRDRNLFLIDLTTMEETQLTDTGAPGTIINGTSDWVYEEEFGLRDGWTWSPDGRFIAFFQLDETNTREFALTDLRTFYPSYERFRYPKAGEVNSEIRVGVIDVTSADKTPRFFDTDTWNEGGDETEYIPQMGWTPNIGGQHYVWMFRTNRDQNELDVLYADPASLEVDTILEEQDDAWIEVETGFSDLDVGQLTYLEDGEHFAWISERDGYRHLYLYQIGGDLVRPLTWGEWDVTDFNGIDETNGVVYFTATRSHPTERHLYRAPLDPSDPDGPMQIEKITQEPGWHSINMSGDLRYYIDTYSNATTPTTVTLHEADGALVKVLEDNDALREKLAAYRLPEPEFITVPGANGTPLNAYLLKPADFDPNRRYPLLMYVYGGPGSQTVRNSWSGSRDLWHRYLVAEHGFIVASVDNRGTGARGKAFKSATYKRLGVLEAQDQIAAAQHLANLPYIDADRIGIWGWSYGGFMTLNSMLMGEGPQTIKVGVSVAPVTQWKLYDTIYTERYMSTPQKNPSGYTEGSPLTYADRLAGDQHLLIIHGDFDDNVHFQNTIQMADALQAAGKQFEMMVYPGRNHSIKGGTTSLHLYTLMTNFLTEHLGREAPSHEMVEGSR